MINGNECIPGGYHGLQSRCPDESWEVGSIPTRFRKNKYFLKFILINFFLISFSFGQGMYVEKISEPIYSLNLSYGTFNESSLNQFNSDSSSEFYGVSLSTVLGGVNQISIDYEKYEKSKFLGANYLYYYKPSFQFNFFTGFGFNYISKQLSSNEKKYNLSLGIFRKSLNKTGLNYYPFLKYDYILHNIPSNENINSCLNCFYDEISFGISIQFNDIGVEPSFTWIDENTKRYKLKIFLWEKSN